MSIWYVKYLLLHFQKFAYWRPYLTWSKSEEIGRLNKVMNISNRLTCQLTKTLGPDRRTKSLGPDSDRHDGSYNLTSDLCRSLLL